MNIKSVNSTLEMIEKPQENKFTLRRPKTGIVSQQKRQVKQLRLPDIVNNSSRLKSLKNSMHSSLNNFQKQKEPEIDDSTVLSLKQPTVSLKPEEDHTTTSKTKTQMFNSNLSTPYQHQIEARYYDLHPMPKQKVSHSASMQVFRNSNESSIKSLNSATLLQRHLKKNRSRRKMISYAESQAAYESEQPRVSVNLKPNMLTAFANKLNSISIAKEHI